MADGILITEEHQRNARSVIQDLNVAIAKHDDNVGIFIALITVLLGFVISGGTKKEDFMKDIDECWDDMENYFKKSEDV